MRALLLASALALIVGAGAGGGSARADTGTADAAIPATAKPEAPQGRLDQALTPKAYRLDLTLDPASPRFSGHVEIDLVLEHPGRQLWIHGRDLTMHGARATIAGAAGKRTITGTWEQLDSSGVARLTFAEPLPAGPVLLSFDYDAPFHDGPSGLFRVKVGEDWYAWSQFESIDARDAFPGFDQPGFKQSFTVTLRTPPGQMALSNAPELSVTRENGLDVHRFAPSLPLPTYLVALMAGPFAEVSGEAPANAQRPAPLPMRIVSTRQNAGKLGFALENSKAIVGHLEAYFGQPFPFPKLDQITAPIMPGAMENAGADLYEDSMLAMDENASTARKRLFGMVVSHELSHQWFGDMVTMAWWDDIWLNESFANWMGFRIGDQWRPGLRIAAGALAEGFAAMNTDSLLAGRPIHQPITRSSQVDEAFDAITYGKGGQVVAMIAAFMGDDKFREGVRRYMALHRYGTATSADFFRAMAEVAGDPRILPALQGFTEQQGVPLLTFAPVERSTTGGPGWLVTQSRYARLGTTPPATRWQVPLCLRIEAERQCRLLDAPSAEIALPVSAGAAALLMPNAGGTGYYRFELPEAEWDRLIDASASLPSGEALALADSARASFMAGRSSATRLARLARTMSASPDSHAAEAAWLGLDSLASWGLLDSRASAASQRFAGGLLAPKLAALGFDPSLGAYAGADADEAQRRADLVARLVSKPRDGGVTMRLDRAAKAFFKGDTTALDPAWYTAAFAVRLNRGSMASAKDMLARALASQDPVLRPALLRALGASGHEWLARWLLSEVKDQRLRLSERLQLIAAITMTGPTREIGYAWVRSHIDELLNGSGGVFFTAELPAMLANACAIDKADEIARDFRPRLAGRGGELELDRTIERVRSCGVLKQARAAEASAQIGRLR